MTDYDQMLRDLGSAVSSAPSPFDQLSKRRSAKQRKQRLEAIGVALALLAALAWGATHELAVLHAERRRQANLPIDPAKTKVVATIRLGKGLPADLIFAGGSIWVSQDSPPRIERFDATTGRLMTEIPTRAHGQDYHGLGAADDLGQLVAGYGSIWASSYSFGEVLRLDIATNRVVATIKAGTYPQVVGSADGGMWVVDAAANTLYRIDPGSNSVVTYPGLLPGSGCFCSGANFALSGDILWFHDADKGTLYAFSLTTRRVTTVLKTGVAAAGVTLQNGFLWVAGGDGWVRRYDPVGHRVTGLVRVGGHPSSITVSEGVVWVLSASERTVTAIDARTDRVLLTRPVGLGGSALVVGGGSVWVLNYADSTLTRIAIVR